jgi:hypothetical protein
MPYAIAPVRAFPAQPPVAGPAAVPAPAADGDMSFWDFLDIINPLQHIPVVSNIWRAVTGDTIRPQAQVAGDILYGGPIGLVTGAFNVAVEGITGRDVTGHLLALLSPGPEAAGELADPPAPVMASAGPAADAASADDGSTRAVAEAAPRMFAVPPRAPAPIPVVPPAADPPLPAAHEGPVDAAIAEKMMRALDGYRALAVERRAPGLDTAS